MPVPFQTVLIVLAALGGVLCLVVLVARGLRATGFAQTHAGQRLKVREALALDRTRRLYIIACGRHELMVLTGSTSEQFVGWLPNNGQSSVDLATGALKP